jgi:hypothetical protein
MNDTRREFVALLHELQYGSLDLHRVLTSNHLARFRWSHSTCTVPGTVPVAYLYLYCSRTYLLVLWRSAGPVYFPP